jgi:hypothetical protein
MASFSIVVCNPNKWGLRDSYTLLGAKHFINFFENLISCMVMKTLMHVIKIGRSMCVTCLLKLKPFLFSQQNVWLSKPIYNIEIHHVNTPRQKQQIKQDKQLKRIGLTF